jgi:Spy/CpxP family protein refolding chaperone
MDAERISRKAYALVLAVFLLGIALGSLGTYLATGRVWGARPEGHGRNDRRAHMVEHLTREVNLTADQQKQLDAILAEMQSKYAEIHKQISPQTEQVRQQGRDQIRALLTPEQKPKFEEFLRRMDAEHKKRDQH